MYRPAAPRTNRAVVAAVVVGAVIMVVFLWNLLSYTDQLNVHAVEQERLQVERRVGRVFAQYEACKAEKVQLMQQLSATNAAVTTAAPTEPVCLPKVDPPKGDEDVGPIAVVLICYNRPKYLQRTVEALVKLLPEKGFPLIISQDGNHAGVASYVRSIDYPLTHIQRLNRDTNVGPYYHIAAHYEFALRHVFDVLQYESVIILEDDMELAPDFFSYFKRLQPFLKRDPSLYCVSAWNDNGLEGSVFHNKELQRTSFFPGLGWMLTQNLWSELKPKWPKAYWDDWMREDDQRRGRDCIHPEVSRTHTFGRLGSSGGQFFDSHLSKIKLNHDDVSWALEDLSYLERDTWKRNLLARVHNAALVTLGEAHTYIGDRDVKLFYKDLPHWQVVAETLNLMNDFKAGAPRGAYEGIVLVCRPNHTLYLVPQRYQE